MAGKLCDLCGQPYYRRTLTETWDRQNPGARAGWHKAVIRACTRCVGERQAQRVMILATVRVVARQAPRETKVHARQFLAFLERNRRARARRGAGQGGAGPQARAASA